jgi:hypothetical protein
MERTWKWEGNDRDELRLKLFCDESVSGNNEWIYIGILFVPEPIERALVRNLLNKRCGNSNRTRNWEECGLKCKEHERNNIEVHFKEIRSGQLGKYLVAKRWVDYFVTETEYIFVYILGIDLRKLDRRYFGEEKQEENIYNRFFRTAILKAAKSFFGKYRRIVITEVIHDSSRRKEDHPYFSWHPIFFINQNDEKVHLLGYNIRFLDSDHNKEGGNESDSQLIQFIDLILGCTRNCLDYTSSDNRKTELSIAAMELISRVIEKPANINSSYRYVGRIKIDFFPKHDISELSVDSLECECKRWDSFYVSREFKIRHRGQGKFPFMSF